MALIGSITNQGALQGQITNANGYLTGYISNASSLGGNVVGMRGLKGEKGDKGDKGDAGTTDYLDLENKPQIEGVTLEGDLSFGELNLVSLTNEEIEELLENAT